LPGMDVTLLHRSPPVFKKNLAETVARPGFTYRAPLPTRLGAVFTRSSRGAAVLAKRTRDILRWLRRSKGEKVSPGTLHPLRRHCMFFSSLRRSTKRARPEPHQARRELRRSSLQCEEFEPRLQPSVFLFSTGLPDGKVATLSEPPNAHNGKI